VNLFCRLHTREPVLPEELHPASGEGGVHSRQTAQEAMATPHVCRFGIPALVTSASRGPNWTSDNLKGLTGTNWKWY